MEYDKIVKSYATIHHRHLVNRGLWIDKDDLEGEFYLCYVKAKGKFKEGKGAKFETYLITSINNRFLDIMNKLSNEARGLSRYAEIIKSTVEVAPDVDQSEIVREVFNLLTPREQIIMKDMMAPDENISEHIPSGLPPRKYAGHLQKSIALNRGFHFNEVKYSIGRIRKKVKQCLLFK